MPDENAIAELRAAWDEMLGELARARDAIDHPELMPPPANDRNLAEGYRYLMGFVHGAVERAFFEDPEFPVFRNVLHVLNKGTIDNPDAIYFAAPIDGRASYRVRGRVGRAAPRYLIFELSDGVLAGDSGSLAELRPGAKLQTGRLDSRDLAWDDAGGFEILLAPQRPEGFTGNFIPTWRKERQACWVSGRQLFYDWAGEDAVRLTIERVDGRAEHPPAFTPERAAAQLRRFGSLVRGQMQFWNEFYTVLLETYGRRDGQEGERFMPRNAFNAVNAVSRETGGGQSTNLYAGGVYELANDEALVVESQARVPPQYQGFHLANLWGESHDYANHQSSLNGFQTEPDPDGLLRWVIAHRDPGVPNWIDTTGHREGFMTARWSYSETPPAELWPRIQARKVAAHEIRKQLPDGIRSVSPEERGERIRMRQEHVQRRYRAF